MSNESQTQGQPSDKTLALFLQENDGDQLTDILVEALYEAFRTLETELADTLH